MRETQFFQLTNFIPTDSAFTERIMGFPTDNYKGYVEADATHKAKNIQSDTFFLVHGLADATAPYQHGVQLARSLVDAGTLYQYTVSRFQSLFLFNLNSTHNFFSSGTYDTFHAI